MLTIKIIAIAAIVGAIVYFWPQINQAKNNVLDSTDLDEKAMKALNRTLCNDRVSKLKDAIQVLEEEMDPEDIKSFKPLKDKTVVKVFNAES